MSDSSKQTARTRFCLISDTHTTGPNPPQHTSTPYRYPLPKADVRLHSGDITRIGRQAEHKEMLSMLADADAELKIVIAGNHDITHDEAYYNKVGYRRHGRPGTDFDAYPSSADGE